MALTGQELVNAVLDNLGRSSSGQVVSGSSYATMALRWANRAQRRIAGKVDLLNKISTATTVISQQSYAFPSNLRTMYSMKLENGTQSIKLEPIMPWEFDKLVPKPNEVATGQPRWYIPYGMSQTFELYQIPDAAYVIRMRHTIWPTDLTLVTSSDFHSTNADLDDIIEAYATEAGFRYLQEFQDAATWRKVGDERLGDILALTRFTPDWAPTARGFSTYPQVSLGEYYNDPFIFSDPNTRI